VCLAVCVCLSVVSVCVWRVVLCECSVCVFDVCCVCVCECVGLCVFVCM